MRIAIALVGLLACLARADEPALERHGIRPDREGIATYLRSYYATGERGRRIAALIDGLLAEDPASRAASGRELAGMGAAALPALRCAATTREPELARRLAPLIANAAARVHHDVIGACFRVIRTRGIAGLAADVLRALPSCQEFDHVHIAACEALRVTAGPEDAALLRSGFDHALGRTRYAAALAYGSLHGGASAVLRHALRRTDDYLRAGAARALAHLGEPACLETLCELLGSRHVFVRLVAAQTLRAISPKRFGFAAYDEPDTQRGAAGEWRREVRNIRRWNAPLPPRRVQLGRMLVSHWTSHRVTELDAAGNEVWAVQEIKWPWTNLGLPNGHRIVTYYKRKIAIEYDEKGREVWRTRELPGNPTGLARRSNGNTLLTCGGDSNCIVELGTDGAILRRARIEQGRPSDASLLPNENLLVVIAGAGMVAELDRAGLLRWKLGGLDLPSSAQALENGNVLVCEANGRRIVEYTREGKAVWTHHSNYQIFSVQRLPNGNTLTSGLSGVRLLDREGRARWLLRITGFVLATYH